MINSIKIILPLFIMAGVGALIGKLGFLNENTIKQINKIVYDVLFPCSFFVSTYNSAGKINISFKFIALIILIEIISFVLCYLIAIKSSKNIKQQGTLHQGMFRSNMILFGTAIASNILSSNEIGIYTIALLVILPLQNIGSVVGKEIFKSAENGNINFLQVMKGIITNTHVISILLGLLIGNLEIRIPDVIIKVCQDFGSAGSPIQLLALGATLKFDKVFEDFKLAATGVITKLIIIPVLGFLLLYLFKLNFAESFVIMLLCAAPTAVTVFTICMKAEWDIRLANELVFYSTILSLFSLTFWMSLIQLIA